MAAEDNVFDDDLGFKAQDTPHYILKSFNKIRLSN